MFLYHDLELLAPLLELFIFLLDDSGQLPVFLNEDISLACLADTHDELFILPRLGEIFRCTAAIDRVDGCSDIAITGEKYPNGRWTDIFSLFEEVHTHKTRHPLIRYNEADVFIILDHVKSLIT